MDKPRGVAVITAAGSGSRLGMDMPKALVQSGGRSLLELALERMLASDRISAVVVTCPAGQVATFQRAVWHLPEVERVTFVAGGNSRQASVNAGLEELERRLGPSLSDSTPVLVHDAARALAPTVLVDELVDQINSGVPAAVPGLEAADTIKVIDPETGVVVETPPRANLRIIQTPQAFKWGVLRRAHLEQKERGTSELGAATDDSALVEECGTPVLVISGNPLAFKVTVQDDLARVAAELGAE